jgi:hypothetical protein
MNALRHAATAGEIGPATVARRAELLGATTIGIRLLVRIGAADTSRLCRELARDISSWKGGKASERGRAIASAESCREDRPIRSPPAVTSGR